MLIGAVRGGHVEIVRALLHKYADIDIRGQVICLFYHICEDTLNWGFIILVKLIITLLFIKYSYYSQ